MSQNIEEDVYHLPDRAPSWMLFFEGTLYRRYLNYLNQHDFSQILNNKISLDDSFYGGKSFYTDFPSMHDDDIKDFSESSDHYKPPIIEAPEVLPISTITTDKFLTQTARKRKAKRTRGFICLGIFCIAAFATAVALLMHFVFVKDTDPVKDGDVIHIGNGTLNGTDLNGNQTDVLTGLTNDVPDFISTNLAGFGGDDRGKTFTELILLEPQVIPDNIRMSPGPFYIGDKDVKFTCTLKNLENWKSVFIIGSKVHENMKSVFNFNFSRDQETVIINKQAKISTITKIKLEQDELQLMLTYKTIECQDEEMFTCGIEGENATIKKSMRFNVARKPENSISMTVPVEVVSGNLLRISASWNSGYPEPWGNITWGRRKSGSSEINDVNNETKQFWTFKKNTENCQITVDSFINFTPTMDDNDTEIIAQALLNEQRKKTNKEQNVVSIATETILVVPEDHCIEHQELHNDTLIPHPYTCSKFVRCLPKKIVVFECPTNTCFTEESGQCDYLTEIKNKEKHIS